MCRWNISLHSWPGVSWLVLDTSGLLVVANGWRSARPRQTPTGWPCLGCPPHPYCVCVGDGNMVYLTLHMKTTHRCLFPGDSKHACIKHVIKFRFQIIDLHQRLFNKTHWSKKFSHIFHCHHKIILIPQYYMFNLSIY